MTRTKRRKAWNIIFACLFLISFVCFLLSMKGYLFPAHFSSEKPAALKNDEFDPSLMRLNTIDKLEAYCDSFYEVNRSTRSFPGIVADVVKKKFYHGYSHYDAYTNPSAAFISSVIKKGMAAVVLPNDIVKYPNAACSQQSIVGMEIFKRKGYKVRGVVMYDSIIGTGHFAYEAYYDNDWHYFDPNQEPDGEVLKKYSRPSVAFLNEHPDIIAAAYYKKDQQLFQRLLLSSKIGPTDKDPALIATLFQRITKYGNYFGWLVIGIFLLVRHAIFTRKSKSIASFAWLKKKQGQFQSVKSSMQSKGHEAPA